MSFPPLYNRPLVHKQKSMWNVMTVTVDNACIIHCAKQSHVFRHFSYWFFSQVHRWGTIREGSIVEDQLSGQSLLCCSDFSYLSYEGSHMYVFGSWHHMGKTWTTRLFTSCRYYIAVHVHGHRIALFCPHFSQFPYSAHRWQAYCRIF